MKKISLILGLVAVLLLGTAAVYADEEIPDPPGNGYGAGSCGLENFIDEDGDGVCDLLGSGMQQRGRFGSAANGQRSMMGNRFSNFVDEDGDGVCDLCGTGQKNGPRGQGINGTPGANFVDEDGDGVCDNCGTGQQAGPRGQGINGTPGANFVDEDGDGVCDTCGTGQMNNMRGRGNGQGNRNSQAQSGG